MFEKRHPPDEISQAFLEHERSVRIQNYRVACILAVVFMPAGVTLDILVYPKHTPFFLLLRLTCSALLLFIWWLIKTPFGQRHYRFLGLTLPALPSLFISAMIYTTDGFASSYYAGLNLVLLGAAIVLRWTWRDSVMVFLEVLTIYLGACQLHRWRHGEVPAAESGLFFNNLYFLVVTGVFVVIGSYFYNRLRFREFSLRFELDKNKQLLEENHQKLLELDQVKSRFFANISHELRTPLTLLLAPLESLQVRLKRAIDQESRELLDTMQSNGMRLLKLINDLLDLVRLESGRMEVKREALSIPDFLRGLVSAARQVANDKRIRLEGKVDPEVGVVLGDRDKLEKILLNLQFNALKFTPSGGRVELSARRENTELVLAVQDTGMGISPENLPHVFERFWQADGSSKRKYQGVGIGLSLVKELVEIQEGTVKAESTVGQGTVFTIRLPYLIPEPGAEAEDGVLPSSPEIESVQTNVASEEWLSNLYRRAELFPSVTPVRDAVVGVETGRGSDLPKVLVADDEPDMLRFLKSQLSERYQVLEAVDGQQAIEKASQFLPDIILLDMMMPEKDGMQACRELRERSTTQSIPIILLTARADEATKLTALQAGASDFLSKPFSTTELHVRITNLIQSYQYQQKLAKQNHLLEETIEQLKETETQLVQTEKLASLGRMSAGIIHEINNPLNFAATGLFTLKRKQQYLAEDQQADFSEVLGDIEEGINRVKTIVSDLRGFSHHEGETIDAVNVSELVEMSLRFLSHDIGAQQVKVERSLPQDQIMWANKNKLTQVVVNLVQNSMDALKRKEFVNGEKPTIHLLGELTHGKSRLTVRDNGPGVTPEALTKIFDPFFTTKDVGEGMGLGLSICYGIVQEYDGSINVRSEPGQGCEFILEFPERNAT